MFSQTKVQFIPSKLLAGVILLPYAAAIFLSLTHEIYLPLKVSICLICTLAGFYHLLSRALLRSRFAITSLVVSNENLSIYFSNEDAINGLILGKSFISRYLCLLTVKHAPLIDSRLAFISAYTSKSHILVTPLNLECPDSFRRFRVFSKFGNINIKHRDAV